MAGLRQGRDLRSPSRSLTQRVAFSVDVRDVDGQRTDIKQIRARDHEVGVGKGLAQGRAG
jgi:hypothetical protein